eukprot:TRINITY_DN4389_c0_g1_i2.p1 TRINITY_DN4389_c0_g1~~TRINITY_DN4389_c0_g1_i2.p1  ORF type:complete len:266 (-),score=72.39 TRINITY_DN4389_c0_g1_i2:525-1322(-)
MADRKVLNKYYPPDFDPSKLPRGRKPKDGQVTVRMMLPMSVRCNTCGEYLYRGKKFNAKKETVNGEEYLGVKIFRFYMRCVACSAEFTIKTDPKNSDYIAEGNCSRNFESWRDNDKKIEEVKKSREEEEAGDAMKALENRTLDSKVEMDILEALDEIKHMNARNEKLATEELIQHQIEQLEQKQSELDHEEQELLNTTVFKNSKNYVRRIEEVSQNNEEEESSIQPTKRLKPESLPLESVAAPKITFLPAVKSEGNLVRIYVRRY